MSASYCLTRRFFYDIVDGRMEEPGLFFMLKKAEKSLKNLNLCGGGSRAHKNHTGMYRMQTA